MAPRALYQHIRSPSADRTATPRASKPYATLAVSPRAPPAAQRAEECPRSQPAQSDGCLMQCCATQFPRREHRQNQRATLRASKTYATIAVSPRASPGGVPRPAEKMMDSKGRRKTARKGCPSSFGVPLVTFVTRRKLPPAAEARLKGKTQFINHGKDFILLTFHSCRAGG